MARYLLDTNICIYIQRRKPPAVQQRFERLRSGDAALSVITFGELWYGVAKSARREAAYRDLQELTSMLEVLALPGAAGNEYGEIRAELESAGSTIGGNDLWIAAHARAADLILVTNNEREFRRVGGLKLQNWAA